MVCSTVYWYSSQPTDMFVLFFCSMAHTYSALSSSSGHRTHDNPPHQLHSQTATKTMQSSWQSITTSNPNEGNWRCAAEGFGWQAPGWSFPPWQPPKSGRKILEVHQTMITYHRQSLFGQWMGNCPDLLQLRHAKKTNITTLTLGVQVDWKRLNIHGNTTSYLERLG